MIRQFLSSLQFRVAVVFLLLAAVPLGIVGVFSVRTADRLIADIVSSQLRNMAAGKQDLLARWIAERKADVAVVAGSAAVQSLDPAQIRPYLTLVQDRYGVYKAFEVCDRQGKTVYDTAGPANGTSVKAWSHHALDQGTSPSKVTFEREEEEPVFRIVEPIPGPKNAPQGAVRATVTTRAINESVLSVFLGKTGECYVVDSDGTFVAHQHASRVLTGINKTSESFLRILHGDHSDGIYADYRGHAVLGAWQRVGDAPWYLVVEQDRDEAFESYYGMVKNIALVMAITVAGAIVLSWVMASHVTSPIRALSAAAEALSRGDFQNALAERSVRRSDEIGALDAAFRHMAGQLSDRHARLQQRIGLTEEELRKSEDKLRKSMEGAARSERLVSLGRLASGVAHEVRTPLTSLKLYLQSLREDLAVSKEQTEDFEVAMRQVRRMESTINHFLDFARPREPALADVDLERLVEDALVVVQPRANEQDVEVVRSVAPDLPTLRGDVRQLGEALVNLLVNALDVMPDGGRLTISVAPHQEEPADPDRRWLRIDVADTGPGIREVDLERLFEPFFTTKAAGSGLGLAIVQGTVERHGGKVKVQSRVDEGTTFSMLLPVTS